MNSIFNNVVDIHKPNESEQVKKLMEEIHSLNSKVIELSLKLNNTK